jgi:transcriptional regulator with XRE-family HTH domain
MNHITEKIREVRTAKSISQEYMANQLGIDTSSYHRIERGSSPLSVTRLALIASVLEVEVVDLINARNSPAEPAEVLKNHPYVKHLEDEVCFLRQQLSDRMAGITPLHPSARSSSPYEARRV